MGKRYRYYAVKRGRHNKIFTTWETCEPQVKGFEDVLYKGFNSYNEALNYLGVRNDSEKELKKLELENTKYFSSKGHITNVYVDGSYKDNVYSGAYIVIKDNKIIYERSKRGINIQAAKTLGPLSGELNATMLAVQYAVNIGSEKLIIYHDNYDIRNLLQQNKKPKDKYQQEFLNFVTDYIHKSNIKIDFVKVKSHNNNKWNEYVDKLAVTARKSKTEFNRDLVKINTLINECQLKKEYLSDRQLKKINEIRGKIDGMALLNKKDDQLLLQCRNQIKNKQNPTTNVGNGYNWSLSYQLYKEGFTFIQIQEKRGYTKRTITYHLLQAKLANYEISLDSIIPRSVAKKPSAAAKKTYKLLKEGLSIKDIITQAKKTEKTILNHIVECYRCSLIKSIDNVLGFSVTKQKTTIQKDEKTGGIKRYFDFLLSNKSLLSMEERKKANILYKNNGGMKKEDVIRELSKIIKSVNERRVILDRNNVISHKKTYYLYQTALDINTLSSIRNLQKTTIIWHLIKCHLEGINIELKPLMSSEAHYDEILNKIKDYGTTSLGNLKEKLPEQVSYDDIRIVAVLNGHSIQR